MAKLASLLPAALVLRAGKSEAALFARRGDLAVIDAAAVFKRDAATAGLERVAEARVPLADAENARLIAFRPRDGGLEHLAILIGSPDPSASVLVRLHSECFTGDLLASLRCDCGDQLRGGIAAIAGAGGGVLLYLAQEGRGIGLVNKLRPIGCRMPVSTPSTPTSSWGSTPTSGSTCPPRKCCGSSVSAPSGS